MITCDSESRKEGLASFERGAVLQWERNSHTCENTGLVLRGCVSKGKISIGRRISIALPSALYY